MKTETKQLIITTSRRVYRVEIPCEAKVTFGPVVPASGKRSYGEDGGGTALRIYNGKENQMAVFRDVVSFFDTSLPIDELVVEIDGKTEFSKGKDHEWEKSESNRIEKWVRLKI